MQVDPQFGRLFEGSVISDRGNLRSFPLRVEVYSRKYGNRCSRLISMDVRKYGTV